MLAKTDAIRADLPWVEKYRPRTLDDVKGHDWIIKALKRFVRERKIPHMIFTGPAGTGKTSSAVALARDLLGENYTPDKILEMNASDNVRMDTVQNEIKNFTESMSLTGREDFKLIILDEADNIPKQPQQALRRIIERCPPNIKFIFMVNYENRLIDPIISRCALFRFTPLKKEIVIERLKEIALCEGLKFPPSFFDVLYEISFGDMRKAVNLLQMASGLGIRSENDYGILYEISGFMNPALFDKLDEYISDGNFREAVKILKSTPGISGRNLIIQLFRRYSDRWGNKISAYIYEAAAEFDYRITVGADISLQLEGFIAFLCEHAIKTASSGGSA